MNTFLSPLQAVLAMLGVVCIIALLSLLVSVLMETVTLLLNTRARRLIASIQELLQQDQRLFKQFLKHPRFRQIVGPVRGYAGTPQYFSADTFADIFLELLQLQGLGQKDATLSEVTALDTFLKLRFEECGRDAQAFKIFLAKWYNEKMDFASGAYRARVRDRLFFISLVVAVLFNADIIGIYSRISASFQKSTVETMTVVTQNLDRLVTIDPSLRDSAVVKDIEARLLETMQKSLEPSDLYAAPQFSEWWPRSTLDWLIRLCGYFISALLMAYGAQFWYTVVSRMVLFRGGD